MIKTPPILFRLIVFLILFLPSVTSCVSAPKKMSESEKSGLAPFLKKNPYHPSVKMFGKVSLRDMNSGIDSRASILLQRPDSFRITFSDAIGTAWFLAVSNRDELGIFIPSKGVEKIVSNDESDGIIEIGRLKISESDLLRFIHPGLEERWLWGGELSMDGDALLVAFPKVTYKLRFDEYKRLLSVEIVRPASPAIDVSYIYKPEGGLRVELGGFAKFDFKKVEITRDISTKVFQMPHLASEFQ